MTAWEAILLGLVQGLTEFLPISSSAHLRIVGELIGSDDPGAAFTAITQLGTESAVLLYYRRKLATIAVAWWRALSGAHGRDLRARLGQGDPDAAMAWYIVLGSIPIVVLGLAFEDAIETSLRNLWITVTMLVVFAVLLLLADLYGAHRRSLTELAPRSAIGFGLAQALALVPGVSRSGGTITAGLTMGFTRSAAADYSFLLALPAVLGSGFYQLFKTIGAPIPAGAPGWGATITATLIAFVVGYILIIGFLKIVSNYSYRPFVYYRFGLAAVVVVLLLTGVLDAEGGV
ncbi:undecaprenyl-diphosphatase UppP [Antribacter sp. KLBMP9083]|uniref:Undecaprenyl-diphosphatase n=1 Tax=Antribacter soli TaxID=2910976 RepID=A0AA41QFK2_9MICO|nr:undecaprenyl-diphosphatase UppP [Antribacter soli]MCF4121257.1 undecaprenyl-diphosphatase UppP [Antribacter soli]